MTWSFILLFGISGGEILILLLLVLILFGPKKIPEIARMVGKGIGEVKKVQREINSEIHRYSSEIEKEARAMDPDRVDRPDVTKGDDRTVAPEGNTETRGVEGEKEETPDDDTIPYPYRRKKEDP